MSQCVKMDLQEPRIVEFSYEFHSLSSEVAFESCYYSVCKDTLEIWNALNLKASATRCNCVC